PYGRRPQEVRVDDVGGARQLGELAGEHEPEVGGDEQPGEVDAHRHAAHAKQSPGVTRAHGHPSDLRQFAACQSPCGGRTMYNDPLPRLIRTRWPPSRAVPSSCAASSAEATGFLSTSISTSPGRSPASSAAPPGRTEVTTAPCIFPSTPS